ncbi:MAG: hypothetical protein NVSMB21_04130 [Vulcanimicrobiaceae bacterium]
MLSVASVVVGSSHAARAASTTIDGTVAPIVRITIAAGDVTIRTWDRASVEIDGDPSLSIRRRTIRQTFEGSVLIPHAGRRTHPGEGLPAESFVIATIPPGPRDAILVASASGAPRSAVVVTIPSDAAYVFAFARDGDLDVRDYRAGTLVGFTNRGRLALARVGGTIFAQAARGGLDVVDSTFERMRARSLSGDIVFERCRGRQIEATSVGGAIVYDSGSFEPGLARFESQRGDVAIGTRVPALLAGRTGGSGHVYADFARGTRVVGTRDDARAFAWGGGPVVTATTLEGDVYLYDGGLRARARLGGPWRAPLAVVDRHGLRRRHAVEPASLGPPLAGPPPRATPLPFASPF